MFRKTDPQQHLFGVETGLPAGMRVRLKESWAEVFKREVLPILLRHEGEFDILYGTCGRPNFSVGRMLALCLLQELCGGSTRRISTRMRRLTCRGGRWWNSAVGW